MSFLSARKAEALISQMQQNSQARHSSGTSRFSANTLFLLQKPGHLRGELDLLAIEKEIRRHAWIESLPAETITNKDMFHDLVRALSLRSYEAGTVLHKAGQEVDTMYVVVSGCLQSVHIIVDDETDEVEEHVFKRFRPGDVAGHKFLDMMADWPTTLRVEQDQTQVIEIHRDTYNEAVQWHESRSVQERAAFLKHVPPFSRWGEEERVSMARMLKMEYYPSNTAIVRQGGVPKKFYIVFQGFCRILKEVAAPCRSLTILRAPLGLRSLSHSSADPHPISVKRRPVTADNHSGKSRNFGNTSWRCPMWRESLPRPHRWELADSHVLHKQPFTVSAPAESKPVRLDEPPVDRRVGRPYRTSSAGRIRTPCVTPKKADTRTPPRTPRAAAQSGDRGPSPPRREGGSPRRIRRHKCRLVHDYHGDELEGSKKVIIELRELWRGQFFGEQGIINKTVNSATVVACSAVQLLVLSKLDFCRLQQDTGEGAQELNEAARTVGYRNDTDDIVEAMKDEFHWTNFKQDIATDSIFGCRFADQALATGTTGWAALDNPEPEPEP